MSNVKPFKPTHFVFEYTSLLNEPLTAIVDFRAFNALRNELGEKVKSYKGFYNIRDAIQFRDSLSKAIA